MRWKSATEHPAYKIGTPYLWGRLWLARAAVVGMAAWSAWFIASYKANLHCTQYTSFALAMLDTQRHLEDRSTLLYEGPFMWPLRVTLGIGLAGFLAWPALRTSLDLSIVGGRVERRVLGWVSWGLVPLVAVVPVGERFSSLFLMAAAVRACQEILLRLIAPPSIWKQFAGPEPVSNIARPSGGSVSS